MAEYRTEEEQIELLKNWWKESGTSTVVGVVIALSGWLCWTAWQNYNVTQVEVAAGLYQELSVGQEGDASADLVKEKELTSKLIESHSDSVYMVFANLQLAKSFMDSGDLKAANASLLLAKATADSLDSELATLIAIRLARVQIAQADYAAALATVNAIKNSGEFESVLLEIKGDILFLQGQLSLAAESYKSALKLIDASVVQGRKQDVELKLADFSLGSTVEVEVAPSGNGS